MMDLATAIAYVQSKAAASIYPTLTTAEVQQCVEDNQRFTVWVANTAYNYGDIVMPTVRNGHLYRCVKAGTSGATEPVWLVYLDYITASSSGFFYTMDYLHNKNQDIIVTDGATLTWQQYIPDFNEMYDVRTAIYDAWLLKADKVANDHDFATDLQIFKRDQVHQNCLTQAAKWAPVRIV